MKNLEGRILKGFKDNIAISNMEEELLMNKSVAKKITLFSILGILGIFSSFTIVNAATNGELMENVKNAACIVYYRVVGGDITSLETVKVKFDTGKLDEVGTYTNEGGITSESGTYTIKSDGEISEVGTFTIEKNEDGTFTMQEGEGASVSYKVN